MTPQPITAHAGHWLVDLVIYSPVLAFGIWLIVMTVRARRRDEG